MNVISTNTTDIIVEQDCNVNNEHIKELRENKLSCEDKTNIIKKKQNRSMNRTRL